MDEPNKKQRPPGQVHDFSSTQVDFPPEIAQHIIAFGKAIPDKDLAKEEGTGYGGASAGDGRETEIHTTLKYGLHGTDPKPVADSLKGEGPVKVKLGENLATSENPEHDVLKIDVHSPDLHRMNKKVADANEHTDTFPDYKPHLTIAYLRKGAGDKYSGLSKFEGMEATIPHVTFSSKNGAKTKIPLTGDQMPKSMAYQRRAARAARKAPTPLDPSQFGEIPPTTIPHEAVTDAPNPLATDSMAAGGLPVARGNSNLQPLTPEGQGTVARTGADLAALGGPDQIVTSPAVRATETAGAVQAADPKRPPVSVNPGLESQAIENLEGEAKSPGVRKFLADLVRKHPDYRIPGQGAMSSRPSESFNESRVRILSAVRGIMQALAENPHQSIAVAKHTHVSKMIKGWVAKGTPDDLSVDHNAFLKDDDPKPGEVEKFAPDASGKWGVDKFDPGKRKRKLYQRGRSILLSTARAPATQAKSGQIGTSQRARGTDSGDQGR